MEFRRLGDSGLRVSEIGLGCNNFGMRIDEAKTTAVVEAALTAGITFFDTADVYGGTKSEVMLGKALGARRNDIVLATKFGMALGPAPYSGADRGATSCAPSRRASPAWGPTISTSCRCICSTLRRPSKRPCGPSTT